MVATFSVGLTVPPGGPLANLSAVITYKSTRTTYTQAGAQDVGDYTDPAGAFVQKCLRASRQDAALPGLTVWFRPDAGTTRKEIVFELGVSTMTPVNMGAYTAEIYDCGVLQATVCIPLHYWFSRWRWNPTPRPVRKTAPELTAANLVPHYDSTVLGASATNLGAQTYSPMLFAGMTTAMGGTGDRPDIGILTEWQANWLCKGALLPTVLAQGEASGTLGMHIRDATTGAPFDLIAFRNATMYAPGAGTPYIPTVGGLVSYDDGHSPSMSYLPALLTGDPYFIEALQFQANFEIVGASPSSRYTKGGRYGAWALRNKAYAAVCSPESPPSWMLPASNFRAHMENVRQKIVIDMASTDPILSEFRCNGFGGSQGSAQHPTGTYAALWQDSMQTLVYSFCVQLGFIEWLPQARWRAYSEIKRLNGMDWYRAYPAPYQQQLMYTCGLAVACSTTDVTLQMNCYGAAPWPAQPFQATIQNETVTVTNISGVTWTVQRDATPAKRVSHPINTTVLGPKFTSWAEAAARTVVHYPTEIPFSPTDPTGMAELYNSTTGSVGYSQYVRAALAAAVRNGITEAAPAFAWIDGQFAAHVRTAWHPRWNWMVT